MMQMESAGRHHSNPVCRWHCSRRDRVRTHSNQSDNNSSDASDENCTRWPSLHIITSFRISLWFMCETILLHFCDVLFLCVRDGCRWLFSVAVMCNAGCAVRSAQVVKNGAFSSHTTGHSDASAARGRQSRSSLLPAVLHLCCPWRRTLWSNRWVNKLMLLLSTFCLKLFLLIRNGNIASTLRMMMMMMMMMMVMWCMESSWNFGAVFDDAPLDVTNRSLSRSCI